MSDAPPNPPRWAPDPLGRHEYRYWDGGQWTEHVSDNGMVAADPPIAPPPPGAGSTPAPNPSSSAHATSQAPAYPASYPTTSARRDPTAVLGRRYGAFFIDLAICLVAFTLLFFPFAKERSVAETLRLPGCHLSSSDSSRVECNNRAVIQLNDTVYEANGGVSLLPRGGVHLPLLRGDRSVLRWIAREADDPDPRRHPQTASASASGGRRSAGCSSSSTAR